MTEQPTYIFNHIPRTAGGALLSALATELNIIYDYLPRNPSQLEKWLATPVRLKNVKAGTLLAGHFTAKGARLHERYPEALDTTRFRLITFLRRPYSWCASHMRYFGMDSTAQAIHAPGAETGVFARILGAPTTDPGNILERYWFVGITEKAQDDTDRLLSLMGRSSQTLATVNQTVRKSLSAKDEKFVRAYDQRAVSDHNLYELALRSVGDE